MVEFGEAAYGVRQVFATFSLLSRLLVSVYTHELKLTYDESQSFEKHTPIISRLSPARLYTSETS